MLGFFTPHTTVTLLGSPKPPEPSLCPFEPRGFPTLTTTVTMAASPAMTMLRSMVAPSAIHDGKRGKEDYTDVCHPGTREEYLEALRAWSDKAPEEMRVQWANAIAGAGKTAMLRTFCTSLEEERGFPPISFFIWRNDLLRNTLDRFPATVSAQLCRRIPALVPYVEKAINEDSFLLQSAFKKQMDKLVIGPLLDTCDAIKREQHLIFVVDGLDELDAKGQTVFLNFVPYFLSRLSSLPISLLVSSRPEVEIVAAFKHPDLASITRATRIGASDKDIWKFINDKFLSINLRYPNLRIEHGHPWPSHTKRAVMVMQSSGLFIWPTVAIDYIDKVAQGLGHNKRLEQVLSSAEPKPWIASPLDNLYRAILQAHAPEDPGEFLRFKQWLAYFCLPVGIGKFIWESKEQVINWTNIPVRVVFDEALDELWDSVAGLSSLFLPRTTLIKGESPTPGISHRSLRDFTFNRARCGDKLYCCSEQELHTEIVCKFIKFFNTRQAYQSGVEISAEFIERVGDFLKSHLKEAAVSEELGHCMDDVMLDYIPPTWPLVTQMYLIVKLFDGLYVLADNPDFPEGERRREALLSNLAVFVKSRVETAEEWDLALLRLSLSTADFESNVVTFHSVHCWHIARSRHCACMDTWIRNIAFDSYRHVLCHSTLFQHAKRQLLPDREDNVAKDTLDVLQFIVSLSETSPRASQISSFIRVRIDYWICALLRHCPPNDDLYNALVPICAAPLPNLPEREGDDGWKMVEVFLNQTDAFYEYTACSLDAGIKTKFPPIKIPDDWWEDEITRMRLIAFDYDPPFDIPNDWWKDRITRKLLLNQGYNPPFNIPDDWWEEWDTRTALLKQGYKPPFNIPDYWWRDQDTRIALLKQGYTQPTPAPSRAGSPMMFSESHSEDAASHASSSQPPSLSLSPPKSPSVTLSFDSFFDTQASEVEDVLRAPLPIDPTHVEPTPTPALAAVTATTLETVVPSRPVAHAVPVPDSASVEQATASGTNGSVSDAGALTLGQRPRSGGKAFFKRLFRRR